jgi:hypothetical protein
MRFADLRFVVAVSLLTALPCAVHAQWSSDPANNLVIADRDNEQVQPKIVPTADGGFYISWFDNATGGYDVYLQRVDAGGNEQWVHNGVEIANRDMSSTQDYGLDIDADGNALLAFGYNDGGGTMQVLAQKVAPDGTLLWGDPGIFVSNDAGGANAPKITATGDGNVAVGWTSSDGAVVVQKLDGDGNPLWGTGVSISSATAWALSDLHADADGNVIASWVVLQFTAAHAMYAQKLAAIDGGVLWGTDPVTVYDATDGALQFGNFPPFIPDGSGGAVFVWYTVGNSGEVRAQHVTSDGTQVFPQNGALASTDDSQNHFEPDGAYDAASGDIYALWRETDVLTQGQIGVYAQRFDSTGARQWGDGGLVLVPLSTIDQTEMTALPVAGGGMVAAWSSNDFPNPTPLHAARLDTGGNYVWTSEVVDFSTEPNDTARLAGAVSADGYFAYAWTASAASFAGDIHAQNINPDGTLGVPVDNDTIFANGFDP